MIMCEGETVSTGVYGARRPRTNMVCKRNKAVMYL